VHASKEVKGPRDIPLVGPKHGVVAAAALALAEVGLELRGGQFYLNLRTQIQVL
jgi:hypothetical protein